MKKGMAIFLASLFTISTVSTAYAWDTPKARGSNINTRQAVNGIDTLDPLVPGDISEWTREGASAGGTAAGESWMIATGTSDVNSDESAFNDEKMPGMPRYGELPALGWNSWNAYGKGIDENRIKKVADAFVELGLASVGYNYVIIDDGCYTEPVSGNYNLLPSNNLDTFESGFKSMSQYIHALGNEFGGLKYGMYSNSSHRTCGSQPAAYAMEDNYAHNLVAWGVDYIKYDYCSNPWHVSKITDGPGIATVMGTELVSATALTEGQTWNDDSAEFLDDSVEIKGWAGSPGSNGTAHGNLKMQRTNYTVTEGEAPDATQVTKAFLSGIGGGSGNGYQQDIVPGEFTYTAAAAGDLVIEYSAASGGRYLQVDINGTRVFDGLLPSTGTTINNVVVAELTLMDPDGNAIQVATNDKVRFYNNKDMESSVECMAAFKDALMAAGGTNIRFGLCEWGGTQPYNWGFKMGDSYRVYSDVKTSPGSASGQTMWGWTNAQYNRIAHLDDYNSLATGWGDADMMIIGDLDGRNDSATSRVSDSFNKWHMTSWAMSMSPILLGSKLDQMLDSYRNAGNTFTESFVEIMEGYTNATPMNLKEVMAVILNQDVLALHQDALAVQAKRLKATAANGDALDAENYIGSSRIDVLAKPLANGDVAVMFNNPSGSGTFSEDVTVQEIIDGIGEQMVNADAFENASKYYLTDVWTKETTEVTPSSDGVLASVTDLPIKDQKTYRISLTEPGDVMTGLAFDYKDLAVAKADANGETQYKDSTPRALATLTNASDEEMQVAVVVAKYNAAGKQIGMMMSPTKTLAVNGMVTLQQNIEVDADVASVKAFVMDMQKGTFLGDVVELVELTD